MAYCRNCGHDLGSGAKFCPECGQDQSVSVPQGQRIQTEQVPVPPLPDTRGSSPGRTTFGGFFKRALQVLVIAVLAIVILAMLFGGNSEPDPEIAARTFTDNDYAELATDPAAFEGASVDVEGRVFRNPEVSGGETSFQMFADEDNSEWNTIVHVGPAPDGLDSDDLVRVRGKVAGAFEGENAFGASITAVEVDAESVEVVEEG